MRVHLPILILLCLLPHAVCAADAVLRIEVTPADVVQEAAPDGRVLRTWDWGVLVTNPEVPVHARDETLEVIVPGDLTVHGPRDADGRAPLTFLAAGLVLSVDGDVQVSNDGDRTEVAAPDRAMDPRASLALFLGMLILTALMIRQTRRSVASR